MLSLLKVLLIRELVVKVLVLDCAKELALVDVVMAALLLYLVQLALDAAVVVENAHQPVEDVLDVLDVAVIVLENVQQIVILLVMAVVKLVLVIALELVQLNVPLLATLHVEPGVIISALVLVTIVVIQIAADTVRQLVITDVLDVTVAVQEYAPLAVHLDVPAIVLQLV